MTLLAESIADYSAPNTADLATEPLYLIPIARIDPNPDNPRKRFDPEQLEELAADLRARGVLQSLVVRRRGDRYELIAGERRYRAAQLAGLETVPCRIREYASDQDALLDMLAENLSRADLNPWEEARAYSQLLSAGMTQGEVAAQFGKSQPTIANTLKLLELPEPVQELVAEGRLSKSKAQQVGRFATSAPEYCLWLAGQVAERGISEAALREALPLAREAVHAGLIQPLYSHSLSFSVSEVCKGCPHLINSQELANPACGNVALFREHEAEGKRRQQEEARRKQREAEAERERLRARLEAQRQKVVPSEAVPAGEAHSAPNTEGPATEGTPSAAAAPPAPEKKQPKLVYYDDLRWKHPTPVVQLELGKLPAGCQGKLCPCAVALPKSEQDPRIIWCCDRPGHHQSLAAKNTRANKKSLRAEFADRIETALHQIRETAAPNSAMLAPIAYRRFKGARKDALRKALDAIGLPWPVELLSLTYFDERLARPQVLAALRGLPVLTLIELCLLVGFYEEAHEAVEYQRDYCPQLDTFLGLEPTAAARKDFQDAVKNAFRTGGSGVQVDANLRAIGQPGIPNPNAPAVSEEQSDEEAEEEPAPSFAEWREEVTDTPLPADQCPQCGHQLAADGSCPGCVPPPAEVTDEEVQCFRCGDPLPIAPCAGEECEHLANGVTVDPRGCIATPQGAYYCRSCRPGVRICRECGCTDEAGCEDGCSWVEFDLCSACTGQLHLPETEPSKPGKAQAATIRIAELEAEIAKLERAAVEAAAERCRAEKVRGSQAARPVRERIAAEEREKRAGQIETLRRKSERIRAGAVEPAAAQATAAEAATPQPEAMSCSRPDCRRPLTRSQHEVSLRRFGNPLCPPCQKWAIAGEIAPATPEPTAAPDEAAEAKPQVPAALQGVQPGDTVCGTLVVGGSVYQCPVLRIEPNALVIRVLFGEKAIPWTEPALAYWKIARRAGQVDSSPETTCTECGLVLGSSDAGQGQRVRDALLCGQCLSTNTVREKHGLELIPAEDWGAERPKSAATQKASPKYEPGAHITWVADYEGKPRDWKGIVVGLAPHTNAAYQVDAYEPVLARVQVPRNSRKISRLPSPAPEMTYGPSACCDFQPASLDEPAAPDPAGVYRKGVSLTWRDPVSFRGRTGEITGIDDSGIATIEATDRWEPQVVFCQLAEMPGKGFRVVGAGEYFPIAVAAAAKGDAAMWPMDGLLYRGIVWEPLAEHLVIDTTEPVVKRMTVERNVEGLVVMTKGGGQ